MKATFYCGRFQPITSSHGAIIDRISTMPNPIVFVIDGEKSSQNKNKNPLGISLRLNVLNHLYPNVTIYDSSDIINCFDILEVIGYTDITMICGTDRYNNYNNLISSYNIKCNLICQDRNDDISATKIRKMVRNGDLLGARKLMPLNLPKDMFKKIVKEINGDTNNH